MNPGVINYQLNNNENPLLSVKLADNPSESVLNKIKELGNSNPELQDQIFKKWAQEIQIAFETRFEHQKKNKIENIKSILERSRPVLVDHLKKFIANKKNPELRRVFKPIDPDSRLGVSMFTETNKIGYVIMFQGEIDGKAEYDFMQSDNKLINIHRKVDLELRGNKIGKFMESVAEDLARELHFEELGFESFNSNPGITFPLLNGYTPESYDDRECLMRILPYLFSNIDTYNRPRPYPYNNEVFFVKKINQSQK